MKREVLLWTRRGLFGVGAIIATLIAVGAGLFLAERHRLAQFNRTHERPLPADNSDAVLSSAHFLLASLTPSQSKDTLRFAAMPSFGNRWFAVALENRGNDAFGEVAIYDRSTNALRRRNFNAPPQEVQHFLTEWDAVTDGYTGEARTFTDGTPVAFERRRGPHVTSGVGNSPCHYDVLGDASARFFSRYVPELDDLRRPDIKRLLSSDVC